MFNNSLDRPFPKLCHSFKIFPHVFHVCMQKHMVPFINIYAYFGDMLKFFLIGVHDQKCLETVSLVITKVDECLLSQE